MIGITGRRSNITQEFLKIAKDDFVFGTTEDLPKNLNAYFLCAGVLIGKKTNDMTEDEIEKTFHVNFLNVIKFCDDLFEINKKARVCVIGSESGFKGSYDDLYAGMKSALHLYVETKKIKYPSQHLVCVSPTIIEDTGMTQRRKDLIKVLETGKKRRLGRWLLSEEVARIANFVLWEDSLCNTIVRVNGGNW